MLSVLCGTELMLPQVKASLVYSALLKRCWKMRIHFFRHPTFKPRQFLHSTYSRLIKANMTSFKNCLPLLLLLFGWLLRNYEAMTLDLPVKSSLFYI